MALTAANRSQAEVVATLVLGYRDSAPSNEASSMPPSENVESLLDVNSLDDMPEHIREAYQREAEEDALMTMRSSTPFSTAPGPSS